MCSTPRPVARKPAHKADTPGLSSLSSRSQRRYAILANQADARRQQGKTDARPSSTRYEDSL